MHAQSGKSDLDDPFKELESKKWWSPACPGRYLGVFRTAFFFSPQKRAALVFYWVAFNEVDWLDQAKSRDIRWHLQTLAEATWSYQRLGQCTQCHMPRAKHARRSQVFSMFLHDFGTQPTRQRRSNILPATPKVPSSSFEEWVAGDVGPCRLKTSPHDKVVFPMNQLLHSADAKRHVIEKWHAIMRTETWRSCLC